MIWNRHLNVEGKHALISPSKYYWMYDSAEDFEKRICSSYAQQVGTLLHEEAHDRIFFKYSMLKSDKRNVILNLLKGGIPSVVIDNLDFDSIFSNLTTYVNDAIRLRMDPEVVLYFSENCWGTADSILYDEKKRILKIHDLKTGTTPAKIEQLYAYAALFFLEYTYAKVKDTDICLRIYQNNDIIEEVPDYDRILDIMDIIRRNDKIAKKIRNDGYVL